MKRIISILLLMTALAVLCACGTSSDAADSSPDTGDTAQEFVSVSALEPTPGETPIPTETPMPEPVEIEITMDNWNEYFEIVEDRRETTNDSGEVELAYLLYLIALKDEYVDKVAADQKGWVKFEFTYVYTLTLLSLDEETGEVSIFDTYVSPGAEASATIIFPGDESSYPDGLYSERLAVYPVYIGADGVQIDTETGEDFEASRVEGTIYLYE